MFYYYTFGAMIFSSSSRSESRIRSCSAERITVVAVEWVDDGGISVDGDQTLPDSIFSSVGTIRLINFFFKETHVCTVHICHFKRFVE